MKSGELWKGKKIKGYPNGYGFDDEANVLYLLKILYPIQHPIKYLNLNNDWWQCEWVSYDERAMITDTLRQMDTKFILENFIKYKDSE